jgi:orotidine-5'-phosphate decarboxylase
VVATKKLHRIIPALDFNNELDAHRFVEKTKDHFDVYKVGLELFLKYGITLVRDLTKTHQIEIFLDLKLHDIPATVEKSVAALEGLNIKFLTLHAAGGLQMLKQAEESREKHLPNTKLTAVTFLTSLDQRDFKNIFGFDNINPAQNFNRLFRLVHESEVGSMVLSAQDLPTLKDFDLGFFHHITKICPGIRLPDDPVGDQKRVLTPKEAFALGADYLVMGRSLTQSRDLKQTLEKLILL